MYFAYFLLSYRNSSVLLGRGYKYIGIPSHFCLYIYLQRFFPGGLYNSRQVNKGRQVLENKQHKNIKNMNRIGNKISKGMRSTKILLVLQILTCSQPPLLF